MVMQAIKPALRTYTALETLDRTFRVYRDNFLACFGLSALVIVPISVVTFLLSATLLAQVGDPEIRFNRSALNAANQTLTTYTLIVLALGIVSAVLQGVVVNGTLTYLTAEQQFDRKIGIGEAFNAAKERFAQLFGGVMLYGLLIIALLIGLAFVLYLCGIGLAFIVYVSAILSAFLTPVIMLERDTAVDGMRRAWFLGKARFWHIFRVALLFTLVGFVLGVIFGGTQQVLVGGTVGLTTPSGQLINFVLQTVINLFLAPVLPIAYTIMYLDARVRLERFDLAIVASNDPDPRSADIPATLQQGSLLDGPDFTNILILFGFVIGVVVVVYLLGLATINSLTTLIR
jgi:hypothetical protein